MSSDERNNKKPKEASKKPEEAFEKINIRVKDHADPAQSPGDFVRDVCRQWKTDGGKAGGKPRHSDRYIDDQLRARKTPLRSLTPKLVGKTNIGADDGAALIRLFLSQWPEHGAKEGEIEYKPILSEPEIDAVSNFIKTRIADQGSRHPAPPTVLANLASGNETLPGEPAADLISRYFKECDALITIAPEAPLMAAAPNTELIGFKILMDILRSIEAEDNRKRALIWVLDIGKNNIDDAHARRKYLGVQQLITRFKALDHFKDNQSDARLNWLRSRGVIVLLDSVGDWGINTKLTKRPEFSAHHATLTNINPDWWSCANFHALYGNDIKAITQRVYNAFFKASGDWSTLSGFECDDDIRMFGYATLKDIKEEPVLTGLELPVPISGSYSALKAVCAAAAHTLKLTPPAFSRLDISGEDAIKQLTYLGFRVLRIDEFVDMY